MLNPTFPLALTAGLLSFLSPCVLPLVPSYLAYLGGDSQEKGRIIRNSLLFVLGFSMVFIALGASASFLGQILLQNRTWLMQAAGIIVIIFGLMLFGVFKLPFLYRTARPGYPENGSTPFGALIMGTAFAIGWTPCIGPVLGGILTLAGASGTLSQGASLLAVYALGLAIPFLVAAFGLTAFLRFFDRFKRYIPWVERVSGGILVVAGVLMVSGHYTRINNYLMQITPDWLVSRL